MTSGSDYLEAQPRNSPGHRYNSGINSVPQDHKYPPRDHVRSSIRTHDHHDHHPAPPQAQAPMPFIKIAEVVEKKTFDYVVIGGGTAGLTVAARLTEDPSLNVLVLEAGQENLNDPLIDIPAQFLKTAGNPKYDWAFPVVKQKHAHDHPHVWSRGKGLGGSSALNFYAWIKPPAEDIDAFERLGNPGWNWAEYDKYSKKSETFHHPTQEQLDLYPHTFNDEYHGTTGPVQVAKAVGVHTVDSLFQESMVNKGLNEVKDPYGGDINGTWIASSSLDPRTWTRCSAANAYLVPNLSRENLHVLTGAYVSRILFDEETQKSDERTVTGVEFIHDGVKYEVKAEREVILSAGALKSPQILELSGVGKPELLEKHGIKVEIDLPGVGENVQEHYGVSITFELGNDVEHETMDLLKDPAYAARAMELHALGKGIHRTGLTSFAYFPLSSIDSEEASRITLKAEKEVDDAVQGGKLPPGLEEQLKLQLSILQDNKVPDCEILVIAGAISRKVTPVPGKQYVTVVGILNHPISRGTIAVEHLTSNDPLLNPTIDPHYLESETDLEVLVQHVKFIKTLNDIEPWKSGTVVETDPGPNCVSDEDLKEFVRDRVFTIWHTVGSCSMLPKDKSGVVDHNLKVYGTKNLRVVDLSIVPLHVAAHTQATAYVVGEKAADIIKETIKESEKK